MICVVLAKDKRNMMNHKMFCKRQTGPFFIGERQSVSMLLTIRTEQNTRCLLQCDPHFSFSAYRQLTLLILDTYGFTVFSKHC